jgi:hypothetical protein
MPERVDKSESDDLVDDAVVQRAIADAAVGSAEIVDDAVVQRAIGDAAVGSAELDGTYPDGSIAKADIGFSLTENVPSWTEDPNSPVEVNGAQEVTITLADSYDHVRLCMDNITGSSSNKEYLYMRINGDSSLNYNYYRLNGSQTTSSGALAIGRSLPNDGPVFGTLLMTGRWDGRFGIQGPAIDATSDGYALTSGQNGSATSPLDSIKIYWKNGTITGKFEVFGRDL